MTAALTLGAAVARLANASPEGIHQADLKLLVTPANAAEVLVRSAEVCGRYGQVPVVCVVLRRSCAGQPTRVLAFARFIAN